MTERRKGEKQDVRRGKEGKERRKKGSEGKEEELESADGLCWGLAASVSAQ
jgi:hypothetical protein